MPNARARFRETIILVVMLFACATASALADSAADCQQDKDPKLQVQGCTDYLKASPPPAAQAAAHYYRGWAYARLGQYDDAITDLTESITFKPTPTAYYFRAAAYTGNKKYDLAIADYNSALRLKPDLIEVYLYRGYCRLAAGDTAGSVADFGLFIQGKPDLASGYFARARAEELLKENDAAIGDLTRVMSIDPKAKPEALFFRALANEAKGQTDLAASDFTSAIAAAPTLAMERLWVEYLRSIQADGNYANWSGKPYDLFLRLGSLYVPSSPSPASDAAPTVPRCATFGMARCCARDDKRLPLTPALPEDCSGT